MSKLKIIGNGGGIGTFTIISPNSDTDAIIELPHSGGTLVTNSQDLIPTQDEVYDLGSSTKAFKDLNISATTIFLGTQPIRATPTGIRFPELSIGSGLNRIRLRASPFGKLKQISTDSDGVELPEVDIPQKLIDLTDVLDTAPTVGQILIWNDTTSKFEFSIVPEVFSDFTDVDTVTTPPTDTQVLTWSNANNEWGVGNNGFPLTVANTTELLALTGMVVGQEAFVTDLNRSYTYTGSAPNDNWRHAVSGWYATDDIMTNHPPTAITGAPSAATVNTLIPTTFNLSTDDPDEKPATFLHTFENLTGTFIPGVINDLVTITNNNGNITITNNENTDSGAGVGSNTFDVKFTVLDDSLYAVEGVESTTQITRPNSPGGIPNWENNTSWSTGIRMPGSNSGGQFWTHMEGWNTTASWQIPKDPITDVEWTWPHPYNSMQNLYGSQHPPHQADEVFFFGQSVDLDASGNVLAISDPANNRVHIYNYDGTEWIKNQSNIISQYPTGYPDTSNPPAPPIGTYGGIIDGEYLSYGKNQIALSDDGSTLAVAAMDSTDGSGSPHVEIWTHTNNIWTSQQKLYPFSDMPSLPQTAIGMSVSLSSSGDTVVVGYRLAGQTIYQGSQFTTGDVHEYSNGQVYIYERNSDTNIWNTGFRAQGIYAGGSLGAAVDISGDGMYVAMSAPNAVNGPDTGESHGGVADGGYVLIYKKNPAIGWNSPIVANTWLLEETIRPPVADQKANNRFGFNSISLSYDGQHLAVGDIGQALTAVRETQGTGVMYRVLNYNYMTGTDHTFPNGVVYTYKKVSDNWTFNQYVENGSGTKEDGFGDRVSLSHNGKLLSVGAIYENAGFGFPYTLIGNTTFHDYSAKKVFNDWYRFSHSGPNQPANSNELNAWNYTEATQAINCTVNSISYIGFVTPADGKATQYDLRVSFTSKNTWDNDMIAIVIAFNTDANGKEHTISLIRSGGHIGYNYAIVYNYAQPDVQVIYNGVSLINDLAFVWGSTVAATGEGQFVRNRITRIGDQFTVTTSQLLHPNSHTGTDSDLDSSTTTTFNLANYSFGSLFSVANDGARWGFSCQSQDLSSWVNVDLRDAVNPDLIEDTGAVHVFELDSDVPSFTKRKRLLPVISNDPTSERYDPTYAGYSHLTPTSNHHMHNAPLAAVGSTIASGTRLSSSASQVNVWKTT